MLTPICQRCGRDGATLRGRELDDLRCTCDECESPATKETAQPVERSAATEGHGRA